MPDRIGGNNNSSRLFNNQPVTSTNNTQPTSTPAPSRPSPSATDGFGAVRGNRPGSLGGEHLYHKLSDASERVRNGVKTETGTYRRNSNFSYNGKVTSDSNSGSTQWSNRVDSKGSTNRSIEDLGTRRGGRNETSNNASLKIGGFWMNDNAIGTQAKVDANIEGKYGSASGSARVYSEVGVKQMAGFGVTKTGVSANAMLEGRAVLAGAEASGKISTPSVNIAGQQVNLNADVYGRATVGANAGIGGEVAFDRDPPKAVLKGSVGAFAGAKAYGRARFGIGDIFKVGVYGEGWAGVGAEASGTAGYEDGKFSLGGSAGAGLGLGGKVGIRVDIDARAAAALAKQAADQDRDGKITLNDGAAAITNTADAITSGVDKGVTTTLNAIDADGDGRFSRKDLGLHASRLQHSLQNALDANGDGRVGLNDVGVHARNIGQGIQQGAEAIGRGAVATGQAIGRGAEALGNAAHNLADVNNDGRLGLDDAAIAARAAGRGIKAGAEAVGRGIDKGLDLAGRGIQQGAEAIGRGAEAVGRAAHNAADVNNDGRIGLDDAASAARNIGRAVHNAADVNNDGRIGLDDVGNAARNAGRSIRSGAEAVGRAAHNTADVNNDGRIGLDDAAAAARNVGQSVSNTARSVGRGAVKAGRAIGGAARSLGNQASRAADTLADGASRTYKRASATVGRVASFFGW